MRTRRDCPVCDSPSKGCRKGCRNDPGESAVVRSWPRHDWDEIEYSRWSYGFHRNPRRWERSEDLVHPPKVRVVHRKSELGGPFPTLKNLSALSAAKYAASNAVYFGVMPPLTASEVQVDVLKDTLGDYYSSNSTVGPSRYDLRSP